MRNLTYPIPEAPTVFVLDGERRPEYYLDRSDRPEWTHEECVDYEVARETITALIGFRSEWIHQEQQKPAPDQASIARWEAETDAFVQELRGLDVRDRANIARIHRDYGAEVKRLNAAART